MLRQYQTGARGAACLSPSVRWALKGNGEAAASGHAWPMSTKILAVGVTLVGGLVLSVALIMGLEFPKHVRSHLRDDQCVVHERHPKFQSWVSHCMTCSAVRLSASSGSCCCCPVGPGWGGTDVVLVLLLLMLGWGGVGLVAVDAGVGRYRCGVRLVAVAVN